MKVNLGDKLESVAALLYNEFVGSEKPGKTPFLHRRDDKFFHNALQMEGDYKNGGGSNAVVMWWQWWWCDALDW